MSDLTKLIEAAQKGDRQAAANLLPLEGRTRGWSIVDMKKDWKVVFPVEK